MPNHKNVDDDGKFPRHRVRLRYFPGKVSIICTNFVINDQKLPLAV